MKADAVGAVASVVFASGSAVTAAATAAEPAGMYEGVYFNVATLALVGAVAASLVTALVFIHKLLMASKDQQIAQVKEQATSTLAAASAASQAALTAKDELINVIQTANNHLRQRSDVLTDLLSQKEHSAVDLLTTTIRGNETAVTAMMTALQAHTERAERAAVHVRTEHRESEAILRNLVATTGEMVAVLRGEPSQSSAGA